MIKLTKAEQVKRSRIKSDMIAQDPTWTDAEIKLHLANIPEIWVPKRKPITQAQYQKRLNELKNDWCPKEIIRWMSIINADLLELKKKDPELSFWQSTRFGFYHKFRIKMKANPKERFYGLWYRYQV